MAERLFRIMAGLVLAAGLYFSEPLWWVPWFVGIMLTFAGVTNICLIILFLNRIGIK
ncbi:MAG: hypothetical protein CO150_03525 [Nitrospirae bacterium CG_4_9_14_3_um_filter_53_35]|nr:MAG: hypothetical protein COT35_09325 [Nitrospirae bacterium CG08_land_8_20_14_0_20_52_24]PIV83176.1 MAG: hypothetical protein COW52_09660 [Nitrospirae bacterium CG17_big_fil_post_rev_8_21_14_2_50_50_9]PIW85039.1 MAG: hypothetical protein COZ95_06705 [Nitrospirae bacterium CG_4_8_14_3_um_filter_50_41]PIX86965.1 MAG: hypothetical protein COZ32_00640 [Nitrospirae bacterium CG_4_10_14_3_um_filter_53_41]PJA76285.1 MAG: hypothetical protein CO150_03525 [Nitrospirae bacterium CG_4_9_14_3_um_filter